MRSRFSGPQGLDLAPTLDDSSSCCNDGDSPGSSCISAGELHSLTDVSSLMDFDSISTCSSPKHLVHTWTCVTPGDDQGSLQEELRRSSFLSLSQRVQLNRRILQHLLTNHRAHLDGSQSESREHNDTGLILNDSESLQRDEDNQSFFVSAWLPRQPQFEDRACMKRRCVPLRADHNLLTPDTHAVSGVRLHPVDQVRSEVAASLPGHLSDLSSSESAVRLMRRHPPATSPIRFLRFEDETETEAETRYLERQRRRVGQRGTGVLVSKPDLNLYVNGRAGPQGWGNVVDRQHREQTLVENLSLHLQPPVPEDRGRSLYRPHLNLRTEPIRETYIGSVTPGETSRGGSGERRVANNQVRRRTNPMELNGNQVTFPQVMPTTDLPINPYAPDQLTTPTQPSYLTPPISKCSSSLSPPSLMMSQSIRLNGTNVEKNQNQNQEDLGTPEAAKPHRELQTGEELKEMSPCVEEHGLHPRMKNSSLTSEITADSQASPSSNSSSDGQVRHPVRKELHNDDTSLPEHFIMRDESSRLSLRRLFSTVTLSRTRTGSLDRLSSRLYPSVHDPTPSCPRKSSSLLKKTLSVQSLSGGSPFLQLRKSSSVQNFGSDQKRKKDRSADYRPAAEQFLQRCLSLEDVGCPCSVRSVGRVLQVYSDGTFLLEVSRPKNRIYGFIISRGRGRPDSGVYVEDMVDSSTEKLYAGLLTVGDELLEVNGEKVASLSLDQVTHLLIQNPSTTIRVLRHRRTSSQ